MRLVILQMYMHSHQLAPDLQLFVCSLYCVCDQWRLWWDVRMHRLTWAFAVCLLWKYLFHMGWLSDCSNTVTSKDMTSLFLNGKNKCIFSAKRNNSISCLEIIRTVQNFKSDYRNVCKFSDRQIWANSVDPDQTAPQGPHCLPFQLHRLDTLLYGKATLFKF